MHEKIRNTLLWAGLAMIPMMLGLAFAKSGLDMYIYAGLLGTNCLLGSIALKK